jgi:hypothetical protein
MTAFNVVQVRVKSGREDEFIQAHQRLSPDALGYQRGVLIKTGDRSYCAIAEWDSMKALAAARPKMASLVATFRDTLETLDGDLGVSDAVSGEVILDSREDRNSRAYAESMA